jgi:hypothetical protein
LVSIIMENNHSVNAQEGGGQNSQSARFRTVRPV